MRRTFIAGNWKMNLTRTEAVELAAEIAAGVNRDADVEVAVCPSSVFLGSVEEKLVGSPVGLGAQDLYHEPNGAFTGEISAAMLLEFGCTYVILGHSERRHVLGETDAQVNEKIRTALKANLVPVLCVGELLEQREAGQTGAVIQRQIDGSLAGFSADEIHRLVIAYEPVWAIGTGKTASPEQAEEVHLDLRKMLASRYNEDTAQRIRIQYGGSVNAGNAADLLSQPNVDGALVGGASLKAASFLEIIAAAG